MAVPRLLPNRSSFNAAVVTLVRRLVEPFASALAMWSLCWSECEAVYSRLAGDWLPLLCRWSWAMAYALIRGVGYSPAGGS
ncbi:hypothetical protein CI102_1763 [Trichoderma harzianum]|nr:hypothetical protein CI102_1763 [Trichoderma harzianum]